MLEEAWVEELRAGLPELPDAKRARFVGGYGLPPYDAGQLVADAEVAAFYEEAAAGRDKRTSRLAK